MSRVLNIEQFVSDISQRPAIWNRNYHCNKSFMEETWDELSMLHNLPKVTLKAKWKGLRDNFRVEYKRVPRNETTGEFLINLEDHDSKWVHFKSLIFLAEHMRHRQQKIDKVGNFYYQDSFDMDDSCGPIIMPVQTEMITPKNEYSSSNLIEILDDFTAENPPPQKKFNGIGQPANKRPRSTMELSTDDESRNESTSSHQLRLDGCASSVKTEDDDYHFLMSMHPYMVQLTGEQKLKVRMKMQKLVFRELYQSEEKEKEQLESI